MAQAWRGMHIIRKCSVLCCPHFTDRETKLETSREKSRHQEWLREERDRKQGGLETLIVQLGVVAYACNPSAGRLRLKGGSWGPT